MWCLCYFYKLQGRQCTYICINIFKNEVLSKKNQDTETFCMEVEEFVASYSLISDGQAIRENITQQKIIGLKERYEQLKEGILLL